MANPSNEENILKELRFIKNATNAGFLALLAMSIHGTSPGEPTSADWQKAREIHDRATREAGQEQP